MKARLLLLTIVLLARQAGADIVVTTGQRYFGRVVTQTADAVIFDGACKRANRASIRRADVEAIIINRRICDEAPVRLPRAGMQGSCDGTRVEAFEIAWKAGGATVVLDFRIQNDRLHADADAKGSLHGPLDDVRFIRRRTICPTVLDDQELKAPPSFCIEPK